ncbi:glycosyltransferase family 39 protein [Halotia wernerae UHCC 0503]|nr:glycosyltransferase family 39 protein [Halotia wernerae UHCC 0503]
MKIISRLNHYKIWLLGILLIISIGVRLPGVYSPAIRYDEAITLLETAGNARPSWPQKPELASTAKNQFKGTPTLSQIAEDLRQTDVHPPVYYWILSLWRRWLGFSIETSRIFSLVCSIGTVVVLYLLLQAGKIERPLVPSLVFAISSGAIYAGHDARPYALASLLIGTGTLFAYLASEAKNRNRTRLVVYSIVMAICCGIAFQTNYLTLFPVSIILLWFLINLWSRSKLLAIASLLVTVSICLIGFPSFLKQLGARPGQNVGFIGFLPEIVKILKMNLMIIWTPIFTSIELNLVFAGIFILILIILIGITISYIRRYYSQINRKLLVLFLGLAVAPTIGVMLLDFLSNKNLISPRYLLFAGPALAVIITYGIARPISSQPRLIKFLLPIFLGLQLTGINWGLERSPAQGGSNLRSLARTIKASSSSSNVVVVGKGYGRGDPGSAIYELAPETMVVVLGEDSNLEELEYSIQNYEDIWIIFSQDSKTASIENNLLNRLQKTGSYTKVSVQKSAIHLRKRLQKLRN